MSGATPARARMISKIIDIAVECATLRKRFPSGVQAGIMIGYQTNNSISDLLREAVDLGLIKVHKPHPFFLVISAPDGSWSTLGLEAWKAQNTPKPRKCLTCSEKFSPRAKWLFRCDRCKGLDSWEFTHV